MKQYLHPTYYVGLLAIVALSIVACDASMLIAEWIIVIILLDDIYGLTQIRKAGKRTMRRHWKKFIKTSTKYFKTKEKQ